MSEDEGPGSWQQVSDHLLLSGSLFQESCANVFSTLSLRVRAAVLAVACANCEPNIDVSKSAAAPREDNSN